jgi:predicted ATPase
MKKLTSLVIIVLCLGLLAGCVGTPVIYHADCDCPTGGNNTPTEGSKPAPEGALKTGLVLVTDITGSTAATAEKNGEGKYDVTLVAVLVDDNGVIQDCIIDGIAATVKFDNTGKITSDLTAPQTKNELGDKYGMVAWGGAKYEWNVQAKALADFAIGKTVAQLKDGAIDATGKAPAGSDLASSATIYLGGYVAAIEAAVAKATHLGAQGGDTLKMAAISDISGSANATDKAGNTQLEVNVTAITMKEGVITSCVIDSVQAKVAFDKTGKITSDLTAPVKTKNELGKDYGMVAWGGAKFEWNQQAASFAQYVTGKTPAQVAGIAVDAGTKPTGTDLNTSVTIAIGGFQALIAKAAK